MKSCTEYSSATSNIDTLKERIAKENTQKYVVPGIVDRKHINKFDSKANITKNNKKNNEIDENLISSEK